MQPPPVLKFFKVKEYILIKETYTKEEVSNIIINVINDFKKGVKDATVILK